MAFGNALTLAVDPMRRRNESAVCRPSPSKSCDGTGGADCSASKVKIAGWCQAGGFRSSSRCTTMEMKATKRCRSARVHLQSKSRSRPVGIVVIAACLRFVQMHEREKAYCLACVPTKEKAAGGCCSPNHCDSAPLFRTVLVVGRRKWECPCRWLRRRSDDAW